ncbi:class I SAM-dependent methyltransferase [Acetobacteraceae bacterium H6797]|nr:class I SAM-dependent methyltransferase [Acetobacteraceae bacterium H6797]
MMQPAPAAISCKICGGPAPLFGRADFHKSCADGRGAVLPPSGRLVSYWRCEDCAFLFTPDFDDWAPERFAAEIYNDQYVLVDPEYQGERPRRMAAMLQGIFGAQRERLRLLDYGGGDGLLAATLRDAGFDATSWDPFADGGAPPEGQFDVISCFEVMEHAPDPAAVAAEVAARLKPGGMVLFSTLLQPADIAAQGTGWWYLGPRNGHVSLFSAEALRRLWAGAGLGFSSFNEGMHSAGGAPG